MRNLTTGTLLLGIWLGLGLGPVAEGRPNVLLIISSPCSFRFKE